MDKYTLKSLFSLLCLAVMLGSCSKDTDSLELHSNPGSSFLDVENEGYVVALTAQAPPEGQIGTWQVYMGENGEFEDVNNPQSKFFGEPGKNYLLGWEVSAGKEYEVATINVSFMPLAPVILNTSSDTLHNNISLNLKAEAPKFGAEGRWEIIAGKGGRIEKAESHEAQFIGIEDENYTLKWFLTYGASEESKELSFRTDTLRAQAGVDRLDIKTSKNETKYCNLEAFLPAGAVGNWKIIDGEDGTVHSSAEANSLFEGVADELYKLTWTVQIDDFQSIDTVDVRFRGKWGVWTDPIDGQNYRFVEVNGVEWMAENYNGAINPGFGSWYYGHAERGIIVDGYALETEEDRKYYGRLYTRTTAYENVPEGWRLPSSEEFDEMVKEFGGYTYAGAKLLPGGESGLGFNSGGTLIINNPYDQAFRNTFGGLEDFGAFWTSDSSDNGLIRGFYADSKSNDVGLSIYKNSYALSVRYIRDVQ